MSIGNMFIRNMRLKLDKKEETCKKHRQDDFLIVA